MNLKEMIKAGQPSKVVGNVCDCFFIETTMWRFSPLININIDVF